MSSLVRSAMGTCWLLLSTACVTSSSPGTRHLTPTPTPAPLPGSVAADASYDWHGLMLAPFGTLLKDSPVPLHEVLLFRDEGAARGADAGTDAGADIHQDCYAIAGTPPRFVGHQPDRYFMCFEHDRLSRIETSVPLTAAEAPRVFARGCALWLKSPAASAGGHACEGRDGGIAFSAHLALAASDGVAALSITLTGAADVPHAP